MLITSPYPLRVQFFFGAAPTIRIFRAPSRRRRRHGDRQYVYVSALAACELPAVQIPGRLHRGKRKAGSRISSIRWCVRYSSTNQIEEALDIKHHGRSPASSGSHSSAFTVGLIQPDLVVAIRAADKLEPRLKADLHRGEVAQGARRGPGPAPRRYGGLNRFDFVDSASGFAPVQMTSLPAAVRLVAGAALLPALRATPPRISRSRWNRRWRKRSIASWSNLDRTHSQRSACSRGRIRMRCCAILAR